MVPKVIQFEWDFACTSLAYFFRWQWTLMENEFRDLGEFQKNRPNFNVKSGYGLQRFCPGGVLLTEFETSPLQVIWTLRACAALWSSRTVFWEPMPAEKLGFQDSHDFHISGCLMKISSPPEKSYLECFILNETLHVPRFHISSECNAVLWKMNLGISRNSRKNDPKLL